MKTYFIDDFGYYFWESGRKESKRQWFTGLHPNLNQIDLRGTYQDSSNSINSSACLCVDCDALTSTVMAQFEPQQILSRESCLKAIFTRAYASKKFPPGGVIVAWVSYKTTTLYWAQARNRLVETTNIDVGMNQFCQDCLSEMSTLNEDFLGSPRVVYQAIVEGNGTIDMIDIVYDTTDKIREFFANLRKLIFQEVSQIFKYSATNCHLVFSGVGAGLVPYLPHATNIRLQTIQELFQPKFVVQSVADGALMLEKRKILNQKIKQQSRSFIFKNQEILKFIDSLPSRKRSQTIEKIIIQHLEKHSVRDDKK